MPKLKERNTQILLMREHGSPYSKIAAHFKISHSRAQQIVKAARHEHTLSAKWPFWTLLSNRARNSLNNEFGENAFSNPQVLLQYGRKNIARLRNVGKYALREIDNALTQMDFISKGQEW